MMNKTISQPFPSDIIEKSSSQHIVKSVLRLISSYYETRLAHIQALQDGAKPKVFQKMVSIYETFLAQSKNPEEAFILFMKYISQ